MTVKSALSTEEHLSIFRDATVHLEKMTNCLHVFWEPDKVQNLRALHNNYARNFIASYSSRFSALSRGLLSAVEAKNFLIYALSGRSLIEITATLRYYVNQKYKPLFDRPSLSNNEMQELIFIDDQHLRGARFDWEKFFYRKYHELIEEQTKQLKKNNSKTADTSKLIAQNQVNVQTCIKKWGQDQPLVLLGYSLFCDLVHPNVGSSFLIASTSEGRLCFTPDKGDPLGISIFEQEFFQF